MSTGRRSIVASPTVQTLAVFLAVFLVSRVFIALFKPLVGLFILDSPLSEPWTLVTSVYAHADVGHLVSNSVALVLVGIPLERSTTGWAYHAYFVTTGAIAGSVQVLAPDLVGFLLTVLDTITLGLLPIATDVQSVGVLGASGAVFAMLGYVMTGNRFSKGALDSLSSEVQIGLMVAVAVGLTWLTASPGVALIAHFTGLLMGLVAGKAGLLPKRGESGHSRSASYKSDGL